MISNIIDLINCFLRCQSTELVLTSRSVLSSIIGLAKLLLCKIFWVPVKPVKVGMKNVSIYTKRFTLSIIIPP